MTMRSVLVSMTIITVLALVVYVLIGPANTPPVMAGNHDIYNPARTALVNAQKQLAESAKQEQDMLQRIQRMHRELDSSLELLASAETLDPSQRAPIEALRTRLAALKDRPTLCPMDNQTSLDIYAGLLDDIQSMIEHY